MQLLAAGCIEAQLLCAQRVHHVLDGQHQQQEKSTDNVSIDDDDVDDEISDIVQRTQLFMSVIGSTCDLSKVACLLQCIIII